MTVAKFCRKITPAFPSANHPLNQGFGAAGTNERNANPNPPITPNYAKSSPETPASIGRMPMPHQSADFSAFWHV
jgi:hypothetical protein